MKNSIRIGASSEKNPAGITVARVAGRPFQPGDGHRLYSALRDTMVHEAEDYAKKQADALDRNDDRDVLFSAIFARRMDELAREWLLPLLREAAGLRTANP